jgi:hypothetical protein
MMVQQTILKKKNYLKEMLPLVQEQSVDPAKVSISNILQDNLSELKADIIQLQYWLDNKR